MPIGQPTKYRPYYSKILPSLFTEGQDACEAMVFLGITRATFYAWINKYPEFKTAYNEAKLLSQTWWLEQARKSITGENPKMNSTVWVFSMKNKFGWRDKTEVALEAPPTVPDSMLNPDEAYLKMIGGK